MPDLKDGESVEVRGSATKPYVLKNVGGVYSCSCAAWRNQSVAIDQRTCKHLRKLRGDEAEANRLQSELSKPAATKKTTAPPLLLAESWDGVQDPTGWLMSEKLDGVRAYWDGENFISRLGNIYQAPPWFKIGLPTKMVLDGELWMDRKVFQKTISIVRSADAGDRWKDICYMVFDAPNVEGDFDRRVVAAMQTIRTNDPKYAQALAQVRCKNVGHLRKELDRIEKLGGEGLMLRDPKSNYVVGRSRTLLKVKSFMDAEAEIIGIEPGKGRHKGRMGALLVRLPSGKEFSVGTGFSDKQRENPPCVGLRVTIKYQELIPTSGIPRFPVFMKIADEDHETMQMV